MTSQVEAFEPPPDEAPAFVSRTDGLPRGVLPPMTEEEYATATERLPHVRSMDPHRCVYNEAPRSSGVNFQCRTVIPDPRRLRYCVQHATELGYPLDPEDIAELANEETRLNLSRLVPKAVSTLETVMDDGDAPAGVRAKTATDVLDRTGYRAGVDLTVQVEATVVDATAIIRDRLAALKKGLPTVEQVDDEPVEAEVIDMPERHI